jgi:hypothetical protein
MAKVGKSSLANLSPSNKKPDRVMRSGFFFGAGENL